MATCRRHEVAGTGQCEGRTPRRAGPADAARNGVSHQAAHTACTQRRVGAPGMWDIRYPPGQPEKGRGSPILNFVAAHSGGHHGRRESLRRLGAVGSIALAPAASLREVLVLSAQLQQRRRG